MSGLPKGIIARYGISKKAWSVYRASKHGRRHGRRNPTGKPGSGHAYRPRFRRSSKGTFVHGTRAASKLPHRVRVRRHLTGVAHGRHQRRAQHTALVPWGGPRMLRNPHRKRQHRKARRNPLFRRSQRGAVALARPFHRLRGGSMGRVLSFVPLASKADWSAMRQHKGMTLLGLGLGLGVTSAFVSFGGTWAGLASALVLGMLVKHYDGRHAWLGPAFFLGSLIAIGLGIYTSGSLAGPASLGDTWANLQAYAQQVQGAVSSGNLSSLLSVSSAPSLSGLTGMRGPQLNMLLRRISLRGLGYNSAIYTYNPYKGVRETRFNPGPFYLPKSGWGTAGLGDGGLPSQNRYRGFSVVEVPSMGFTRSPNPVSTWSPVRPQTQGERIMQGLGANTMPSSNGRWLTVNA